MINDKKRGEKKLGRGYGMGAGCLGKTSEVVVVRIQIFITVRMNTSQIEVWSRSPTSF